MLAVLVLNPGRTLAEVHQYEVQVAPDLGSLTVEVRLASPVSELRSRDSNAALYTRDVVDCERGQRLSISSRRLRPGNTQCIRYGFDLQSVPSRRRDFYSSRFADNRLVSPATWLWLPRLDAATEIRVRFDLPPGVSVSVPWEPYDEAGENAYRFGPSPLSSRAISVFGDFSYREIEVPGATLRVTLLQGETSADDREKLLRWLKAAAMNVVRTYGRFPNPSPQVVVVPVGSFGRSAVPFGRVIRDGGEAIQFFVNPDRPLADYVGDWTATHEFSHLLLPYVASRQKWISEGFASYYQNVLMARSGAYSEQRAWQKLHEGFERARAEPLTSPNSATMRRSRMMVYWSGAAMALMADVELRRRDPDSSLDSLLSELQACCLPSDRTWTGEELFSELDELGDTDVMTEMYRRYANQRGMPDMEGLYRDLGLELQGDRVVLREDARLASLRRSIMAAPQR